MTQRSLSVRALWFLFIGWWLTPLVVNIAWFLNATIILLPVGIKLINLVPTALTLKEPQSVSTSSSQKQPSVLVRAVWFVAIGWWFSWIWANVAMMFALTIVGLPVAVWMADRLPYVTSLYRFNG